MTLRPLVLGLSLALAFTACVVNNPGTQPTQPPQGQNNSTNDPTATDTSSSTADNGRATHSGSSLSAVRMERPSSARIRLKSTKDPKKDDDKPDDKPDGGEQTPQEPATITAFYPDTASPGSIVEIAGTNFAPKAADNVLTSGGVAWEIKRVLHGRLVAVVPPKAKSGKLDLKVGKKSTRSKNDFHLMPVDAAFARPASHFEGDWVNGLLGLVYPLASIPSDMPDFASFAAPQAVVAASNLDIPDGELKRAIPLKKGQVINSFAIRYVGSLNVVNEGEYELCVESDDGAQLWLEGQIVVNNGGVHTAKKQCEIVFLEAGEYAAEVRYFQAKDKRVALRLTWAKDGGSTQVVPASAWFRPEDPAAVVK